MCLDVLLGELHHRLFVHRQELRELRMALYRRRALQGDVRVVVLTRDDARIVPRHDEEHVLGFRGLGGVGIRFVLQELARVDLARGPDDVLVEFQVVDIRRAAEHLYHIKSLLGVHLLIQDVHRPGGDRDVEPTA